MYIIYVFHSNKMIYLSANNKLISSANEVNFRSITNLKYHLSTIQI